MTAQLASAVAMAILLLAVAFAVGKPYFEASCPSDPQIARQLQQQGQANCTKPRPVSATNLPHCFVPDTGAYAGTHSQLHLGYPLAYHMARRTNQHDHFTVCGAYQLPSYILRRAVALMHTTLFQLGGLHTVPIATLFSDHTSVHSLLPCSQP
jgi:hypothetical protein